jgi:hypothetical protein
MTAAIRSSSVCNADTSTSAGFAVPALACDFDDVFSERCVFLAFKGILPDTYLAAPPFPGLMAGNLFAMTVVDLGMMVVSSLYSIIFVRSPSFKRWKLHSWITHLHRPLRWSIIAQNQYHRLGD